MPTLAQDASVLLGCTTEADRPYEGTTGPDGKATGDHGHV